MKMIRDKKMALSTFGLFLITVWSAVQYLFYSNVPEDISTFAFLFVTNLCGCAVLALTQWKNLKRIRRRTVKKALALSVIQLLMNFFVILGSRNMDPVIISSVMGLYFIFVTPLLLLLRKKVSFRSGVASLVAMIALLLVFNANIDEIFASPNVIFLVLADIFFAVYIVAISEMTGEEDPQALAVMQMICCAVLSLIAWTAESRLFGRGAMTLSRDPAFWVSVLFIGIFIRALYSVIQFAAQKNVPPVTASLIFASEIVITLLLNPLLCRLFGTAYEPATVFQIVGCVLFVTAVLICDDEFMKRFHYNDMDIKVVTDEKGNEFQQVPLSRKIINMNLFICLGALIFSTLVCLASIYAIRDTTVDSSRTFGNEASSASETALLEQVEKELTQKVADKAAVANGRLDSYRSTVQYAADTAGEFLSDPETFRRGFVPFPLTENTDIWAMQMVLADGSVAVEDIRAQNEALAGLETLFASIQSRNPELTTIYVGTKEGLLISYDPNSGLTEESGAPVYYEFRSADWYRDADGLTDAAFTDTYLDSTGRGTTITCYAPIHLADGTFAGAIGMDFLQHDLNEQLVTVGITAPDRAAMVSADGILIATTDGRELDRSTVTIREEASGLPLTAVADRILSDDSGLLISEDGSGSYYVAFNKVEATGWNLCIISPVEDIIAPAVAIRDNIEGNTERITATVTDGIRLVIAVSLVFFAVIVLLITYLVGRLSAKITEPIKTLEEDVLEMSRGNLSQRTAVATRDEIGSLARAFNGMTANLQLYITELTEATAREQRIASELDLAQRIQADSLPTDYPAFPGRKEFDLAFTMDPAKEVGGDFYDFFLIDESHLALVIADVSGKGVPAALFMMMSKMLIKNRALLGGTPAEILAFANEQLCENNKVEMFVTAWLGILDLKTGTLTAANAGHELPAIRRKDGAFALYKDRHGFVLAGMNGTRYRDYTLQLLPGDMLCLYTDGVPEATDAAGTLFGNDRLLAALNSRGSDDCRETIDTVLGDIAAFVGEAPQFDDITMLCLRLDKLME